MSFHAELVGDRAELATLRAGTVLKEEREEGREEGRRSRRVSAFQRPPSSSGMYKMVARSIFQPQMGCQLLASSCSSREVKLKLDPARSARLQLSTQPSPQGPIHQDPRPIVLVRSTIFLVLAIEEAGSIYEGRRRRGTRTLQGRKESASLPCARSPHPHTSDYRGG